MRRPAVAIVVTLGLAVLAASQLPRLRLDTRILEILPRLPAATAYRDYVERFGGIENVFVSVGADGDLERAADAAHPGGAGHDVAGRDVGRCPRAPRADGVSPAFCPSLLPARIRFHTETRPARRQIARAASRR